MQYYRRVPAVGRFFLHNLFYHNNYYSPYYPPYRPQRPYWRPNYYQYY